MRALLPLLALTLAATLPTARAGTPDPLNGTWQLTHAQGLRGAVSPGTSALWVAGGTVRGRFGCGAYAGTIEAAQSRVRISVQPLAPDPAARCPLTPPSVFEDGLNAAEAYVVSENVGQLVLFSGTTRLIFERPRP
ncbi:hypothetical protein V3W47_18240 [Deinococcus sp. YIM 134068]|uniref:hypothetical protein n=1 Tax=Deinococcus lichenicola TaxID=3118910 RepID=UPI002F93A286